MAGASTALTGRRARARGAPVKLLVLLVTAQSSHALRLGAPKLARFVAQGMHEAAMVSPLPECSFQCSAGHPVPKENHRSGANGCGLDSFPLEIAPNSSMQKEFEYCCSEHDRCYDFCNADKRACDGSFSVCMHRTCRLQFGNEDRCHDAASAYADGVSAVGCAAYKIAQQRSCECSFDVDNKPPRRKQMCSNLLPLLELDARNLDVSLHALYISLNPLRWLALDRSSNALRFKLSDVMWHSPKDVMGCSDASNTSACTISVREQDILSKGGALGHVRVRNLGSGCVAWFGGDNAVLDLGCKNKRHLPLSTTGCNVLPFVSTRA